MHPASPRAFRRSLGGTSGHRGQATRGRVWMNLWSDHEIEHPPGRTTAPSSAYPWVTPARDSVSRRRQGLESSLSPVVVELPLSWAREDRRLRPCFVPAVVARTAKAQSSAPSAGTPSPSPARPAGAATRTVISSASSAEQRSRPRRLRPPCRRRRPRRPPSAAWFPCSLPISSASRETRKSATRRRRASSSPGTSTPAGA